MTNCGFIFGWFISIFVLNFARNAASLARYSSSGSTMITTPDRPEVLKSALVWSKIDQCFEKSTGELFNGSGRGPMSGIGFLLRADSTAVYLAVAVLSSAFDTSVNN